MPDKFLSGIYGYEFFGKLMKSKDILIRKVFMFALAAFLLSLALIFHFISKNPIQSGLASLTANPADFYEQEKENFGLPARINIPKINIDAIVEYVGLTSEGAMDAPKGFNNVAWFSLGPRPGENGSAVIAGHYGWKNGKASAFDNLYKLRKGDKLYIEDGKGAIISFVVREVRRYDPEENASRVFRSDDDKSHLNLVTCEGVWNKDSKGYSKRLVVFTDRE